MKEEGTGTGGLLTFSAALEAVGVVGVFLPSPIVDTEDLTLQPLVLAALLDLGCLGVDREDVLTLAVPDGLPLAVRNPVVEPVVDGVDTVETLELGLEAPTADVGVGGSGGGPNPGEVAPFLAAPVDPARVRLTFLIVTPFSVLVVVVAGAVLILDLGPP